MEPLDLARTPPRSPREKLLGLYFLPRTIDKFRAELPGGNLAGYLTDYKEGLSSYLLHKLGISIDDFRVLIARASDEDELMADVASGLIDPAPVFTLRLPLDRVAEGYTAMDTRTAIKVCLDISTP